MSTKIPQTKQEAFAQLDEILSEKDKTDFTVFDPDGLSEKIIES